MYYHHRDLDYVTYGKVGPPPVETLGPGFGMASRWLGQYCGFFPQVWLSRSRSEITGYRMPRSRTRSRADGILFGFESIQGFPLTYDVWCELLNSLVNASTLECANEAVREYLDWISAETDLCTDSIAVTWQQTRDVRSVLSRHLFVKHDQVVVPNLNLKAAKIVVCRNEIQKRTLRQMGFIEDRLVIRGFQPWT